MAKRVPEFLAEKGPGAPRRYPWREWADGGAWEIRRGEDYEVSSENMRVNLHMRADALAIKVRTKKFNDKGGEGLVFQFFDPEEDETTLRKAMSRTADGRVALDALYEDAMEIYERARREVEIPRRDGRTQKYAAVRFKREIERGREENALVAAITRVIRKKTVGFGHLESANRPDLMVETLVSDPRKPYHEFFTEKTVAIARHRLQAVKSTINNIEKESDAER